MNLVLLIMCVTAFLWWLHLALEWLVASRRAIDLADLSVPQSTCVRLSVIIPARNEEHTLKRALTSVLSALPANSEVILVNDRSTDGTGKIAMGLVDADTRLRVLDVRQLPDGWLGKNHAMWEGYRVSSGDYLLFTDADVIFEPDCLKKAMLLCENEGLDHLVATPAIITEGFWERTFVSFFSILLMARFRIWRAANPRSRFYAGIGAFNLVRRTLYEKAGTHEVLKVEAVDDLLLGRLLKRSCGRSKVVSGAKCLKVRWNVGLRGLMEGLEKNAFAAFNYSIIQAAGGCLLLLSATLVPAFILLFQASYGGGRTEGWAALASLGVWSVFALLYRLASPSTGVSWLYFVTFPVGVFLLVWTILRSAFLYHIRGGIKWRGTLYQSHRKD